MKPLVIIQNIEREGPGLILDLLVKQRLSFTIISAEQYTDYPALAEVSGVIVLGGPDSANDTTPKIQNELAYIQEVLHKGMPFLGICLGMQLLVKAVGGEVVPCPQKELGFRSRKGSLYRVQLTARGQTTPLFDRLPHTFPIFHLHGETVVPPPEVDVLGTGNQCPIQLIQWGARAYGIQGHLELTETMLQRWLTEDPDLQQLSTSKLIKDFKTYKTLFRQAGYQLFHNFITMVQHHEQD